MPRRIEAVTVSVGYADFLAWTLPHNRTVFDRLLVVTSPDDKDTKRVCDHYYVETLVTDVMYAGGQKFNKGAAVNAGLERLDPKDWAVHLDGDTALPPRAGELLRTTRLDDQTLYGVDRLMVPTFDAWAAFLTNPSPQHYPGSAWPCPFPMGYRVVYPDAGYLPIGFFQMFNRNSVHLGTPLYPTAHDTAADSDVQFALRWPRQRRQVLGEFFCYHLESEQLPPGDIGVNWEGRRTRPFGPAGAPA
jgi:hypothetical protein